MHYLHHVLYGTAHAMAISDDPPQLDTYSKQIDANARNTNFGAQAHI